ncbi:MAG: hypothetical protein N4A76_00420 [Firmicutes bacterium]|jgi:hypothetical protein|nr:hypothetical protein [Bacillota bacterium]
MDDFRFRRYNLVDEKQYELEVGSIKEKIEDVHKDLELYKGIHLDRFGEDSLDSLLVDFIKMVLIEMDENTKEERIEIIKNKIRYDTTRQQILDLSHLMEETDEKLQIKSNNNRISRQKATEQEIEIMEYIVKSRLLRKGINSLSEVNFNFNELIEMLFTLRDIGNSDFFASGFMNSILIGDKITFVQNKINKIRFLFNCSQILLNSTGMKFEKDEFIESFYLGEYLFSGILIADKEGFNNLIDKIHEESNKIRELLELYKNDYNKIIKKIEQWEYKMDINK